MTTTIIPTFEALPSTHEDHRPKEHEGMLLLRNQESPNPYIKKGSTKPLRTGIKITVPVGYVCAIADRQRHGTGYILSNVQYLTAGTSGEVSVQVSASVHSDRPVRMGEEIGAAWLIALTVSSVQNNYSTVELRKAKSEKAE